MGDQDILSEQELTTVQGQTDQSTASEHHAGVERGIMLCKLKKAEGFVGVGVGRREEQSREF